jgi:hypothetical protein
LNNWDGIVSLFIACIELVLIINVLIFARKSDTVKKGIAVIILLFLYQLMEFIICGLGYKDGTAAYLGLAIITFLPPLSLLFVLSVTGKDIKAAKYFFLPALVFVVYYALVAGQFEVLNCSPFYASYTYPFGTIYGFFYYTPVIISMVILYLYITKETNKKNRILASIILSAFIITSLPVLIAFILMFAGNRQLLDIIESVMCKFAVFIALAAGIYSLSYTEKI